MDNLKDVIKRTNDAIGKLENLFYLLENSKKLEQEKFKLQAPASDVNRMMVKLSILDGKLKDEILKALEDNKLTKIEKDKINDAIKAIEDKILKIKLAINKDK